MDHAGSEQGPASPKTGSPSGAPPKTGSPSGAPPKTGSPSGAPPKTGSPSKPAPFDRKRAVYAWIFLLPALVIVAFIALYPLAYTFYLSFTDTRLGSPTPAKVIGLRNFADLIKDDY